MGLNKAPMKASIKAAMSDEMGSAITSANLTAIENVSDKIANAIDTFVKSGTYTIAAGVPVQINKTNFPPATFIGATTAPATATVS